MGGWADACRMSTQEACGRRIWLSVLVSLNSGGSLGISLTMARHIHRADFHRGLLECASALGIKTYLGERVVNINTEEPSLLTSTGRKFTADLIVASDGLHSMARHIVHGSPKPPVPTGQMVYRVTVPTKRLEGIPELEEFITVPRNNHWIGPGGTILSYLLEGVNETLINFVFT
jgi:salicylate hydroxylase